MNTSNLLIFILGFVSQILFLARNLVQWFLSEKEGKVLSPMLFWKISLFASVLMLVYGILRKDFAIILGQLLVYYIYIRNLQLHGAWVKMKQYLRIFFFGMPLFCMIWLFGSGHISFSSLFHSENMPGWLLFWGIIAQIVFTFRFIYQWLYSEKRKESQLPIGFWYISITGSLMILFYAIMRRDPVLFLGHAGSMIMYLRNVFLHFTGKGILEFIPFGGKKPIGNPQPGAKDND